MNVRLSAGLVCVRRPLFVEIDAAVCSCTASDDENALTVHCQ